MFRHSSSIERQRDDESYRIFIATILTVDYERKVCSLRDLMTGNSYSNVKFLPANASSESSTDVNMPEVGSKVYAVPIWYNSGFKEIAVLGMVVGDTNRAQQGIALRPIDIPTMTGYSHRVRGTYRKAYPGEKTNTTTAGFSERQDDGWDRNTADLSRDWMDPQTRTWTRVTSLERKYTDAGEVFSGPVNRPGASNIGKETLPDGTIRQVAYLAPGAVASNRYVNGQQDVIAWSELTEKIQEFALDFPIPAEVLGTSLLDQVIGTTADPWGRTTISQTENISYDSQSFPITGMIPDHPYNTSVKPVGPTTKDAPTPQRRGYIIERSQGTMVGSNIFDPSTYGYVLKPTLFPYTTQGRFANDVASGYLPVKESPDHAEARLAASAYSLRFTHEANTTRFDVTKEGFTSFEVGATLPKENIATVLNSNGYEHPHGAGRSLEGHFVGSASLVVGKNRDEEESLDITALGQMVLRLGADDSSIPNTRQSIMTQIRGQKDVVASRTLQYWAAPKLTPGDAGSLTSKVGAESISLRGAMDGGLVLRVGARNINSLRRHLINGYQDGPGLQPWAVTDSSRVDSKTSGRPTYGAGDSIYQFHDLTKAGSPKTNNLPYAWSGPPVSNMNAHGLSVDLHLVRDALFRIGANPTSGQSLLLDLAGGVVGALGKDNQGRSITATLDGGIEMSIGANSSGKGIRLEINGDVDWVVNGSFHLNVTGDTVFQSATHTHVALLDIVTKAQSQFHSSIVRHTTEAPDIIHNQGLYSSSPDFTGTIGD